MISRLEALLNYWPLALVGLAAIGILITLAVPSLRKVAADIVRRRMWQLIGLVLTGIAISLGYLAISTTYDWYRMRSWAPATATLTSANAGYSSSSTRPHALHRRRERQRGSSIKVTATYRYEFNGARYVNDRVAIISGLSDNIGDFQADLGQWLVSSHRHGAPIEIWVDPEHPEHAVINRDLRWGLLLMLFPFVAFFGFLGLSMLFSRPGNSNPDGFKSWAKSHTATDRLHT